MPQFILPGAADRTAVIGQTGTGKTILGAWLLSKQNFQKRPWVWLDFKNEEFLDKIGDPPVRRLRLGEMPGKKGLYRLPIKPGDDDALEDWLWKVWERGNIGLMCDEVSLVPKQNALKAILRQGRSLLIPCILCTQRPVDVDREVFTESQYISVFKLSDKKDYIRVKEFTSDAPINGALPPYHSHWYDQRQGVLMQLKPVPKPDILAANIRQSVPYSWWLGG